MVPSIQRMRRPVRWREILIGAAITGFWLTMMFTLARDRILPQRREAALAAQATAPAKFVEKWKDVEEFMLVKMGKKEVGGAITTVRRVSDGQLATYVAEFRLGITLNLVGMVRGIGIRARGDLDSNLDLLRFVLDADLAAALFTIVGEMNQDELLVEVRQGGEITRRRYQLDHRITLMEAVRPLATRGFEIRAGNSMAIPVVDPIWSMNHGTLELTVLKPVMLVLEDREVEAFPVRMRLNDFTSMSWVDARGATLRRQIVGGLTLDQTSPGRARSASAEIVKPITAAQLNVSDFKGLPLSKLERLGGQKKSPLETLGSLMP